MIHPSYYELIDRINEKNEIKDAPVITSRYSIVLATSKRARQLTNGADPKVRVDNTKKLLSVAVEELYEGVVNILSADENDPEPAEDAIEENADAEAEANTEINIDELPVITPVN